ncbi:MAG: ABC transporter ATP-binding protein/permease [Hyphomonadaceae bacterium]|nr:ABC transporter ATP-binding protein/permease [Hyphomonadaceae bacterium]MBY0565144.1 ABC transporter ATP-binding protein/permease [Hyphomonadaceae bacterium]
MARPHEILSVWRRVLALLSASCPRLSAAVALLTLLEAGASVGVLYLIKLLVDAISLQLSAPGATGDIITPLLVTGAGLIGAVLLQNITSFLRMRQGLAVSDYVDQQIHDRSIAVDLEFYESPRYFDALERARQGGAQRPAQIVSSAILAFKAMIILGAIVVLIAGIDPWLFPILLLPVALALAIRLFFTRKLFDWRMARAQLERRTGYLDWLLTSAHHAKELRLNQLGGHFRDQYRALRADLRQGQIAIEQSRLLAEFVVSVLGTIVFILASAWLLHGALNEGRAIGDVVLFVLLLRRAEAGGTELVGNVSKLVDDHLYLQRLFEFLSIKPIITRPCSPLAIPTEVREGVRLENVSFRYTQDQPEVLNNVSLQIKPGQVVALVGENGSGKTTLIKILTRLYDPSNGAVTLDGQDIRAFDPEAYRRLFSVILQDYATYAATVADNIRFADIRLNSAGAIEAAAKRAGAADFIERLPKSYQTSLTRLFDDGHDLSIGQYQRLALARAFYPQSKFIVLDEPTSAVDPKAEFELFENFRERLAGRGALIISHRLSTVRQADYTYVLGGGRIVEHGSHASLIEAQGAYAELFEKQGRLYRK